MKNKNKKCRKLKWLKPEIFKIKLNPEQAVLSCCDVTVRAGLDGTRFQCFLTCAVTAPSASAVSS